MRLCCPLNSSSKEWHGLTCLRWMNSKKLYHSKKKFSSFFFCLWGTSSWFHLKELTFFLFDDTFFCCLMPALLILSLASWRLVVILFLHFNVDLCHLQFLWHLYTVCFIFCWKISWLILKLKGNCKNLYYLNRVLNVMMWEDSLSSLIF